MNSLKKKTIIVSFVILVFIFGVLGYVRVKNQNTRKMYVDSSVPTYLYVI